MSALAGSPDPADHGALPWPADPREAAAWWFARSHSGRFEPEDEAMFARWRRLDPCHEREWQALDFLWQASARLPREELAAMLREAERQDRAASGRPRQLAAAVGHAAGLAPRRRLGWAVAALLLLATGAGWYATTPRFVAELATGRGQVLSETLPDGSVLTLNTDSRATVRYYPGRRAVELTAGEAFFEVTRRDGQAFDVDAGQARVTVTGTAFLVRRDADRVAVAVQSGSVDLKRGPWWRLWGAATRLSANQGASLAGDRWSPVAAIDVDRLTTWRQGKLVFSNQRLGQVVEEINRYLPHPIRVVDPALGARRVSGIVNLDSPDDFQQAVQASLPVVLEPRPDGGIDLRPR